MDFVACDERNGIATLTLGRGKVNALNGRVVDELRAQLETAERDASVRAVVLTGQGKFFSFGFDVPEFLPVSKEDFGQFVRRFTDLYTYMFVYPKPLVAAVNGHAIAGGCMLALACDHRVMAGGPAKIGLNEIAFGSSLFAGATEMLRFLVGNSNATGVLYSGTMYPSEEAKSLGLIDEVVAEEEVLGVAIRAAAALAKANPPAFASVKSLLRSSVAEHMRQHEAASIGEFLDIWYSPAVRANREAITIH
jgi:3,2-trans-enoyl-CoA isomerase